MFPVLRLVNKLSPQFQMSQSGNMSSASSSLVSLPSRDSRSRSQSQSPMPTDTPSDQEAAATDWKARYQALEAHYKEQVPKIREAMAKMVSLTDIRYTQGHGENGEFNRYAIYPRLWRKW